MENSQETKSSKSQLPPKKLKCFQLVQKNLATLDIRPDLTVQPYPFNGRILIGILLLGSTIICIFKFTFYEAKTFTEYTQSIFMGSIPIMLMVALLITVLNVKEMFEFMNTCENLVNTTLKYSETKPIFNETNQLTKKLSKVFFIIIAKMTPVIYILPWTIYTYFIYITTDLGNEVFELPIPMWLPFDWRNPFGYLIAIAIQGAIFSYGLLVAACILTLGIEFYIYLMALSKCFKKNLFFIDRSTKDNIEISEQFIEFIEFHSRVKQCICDFSDVYQYFFTILCIWSLVTICGALLIIQTELLHLSLAMLSISMVQIVYAFGVMLTACELCQRVNLTFDACSEMIDQFEWYLFPAEIQRLLPIIIHFVQQPIELKCFGSTACDRETFKYVTKKAYSYFTILRKFYD